MSTIRFRFSFNQGKTQQVSSKPILAVVENVAIDYAERTYERLRTIVSGRVERDVLTEFSLMAGLFKQFVVGVGPSNTGPRGTLTPAHTWAAVSRKYGMKNEAAGQGIAWPKRTQRYMNWKDRHFRHGRWFLNNNQVLPATLGSAKNWVRYFGPIEVKIQPMGTGNSFVSLGRLTSRSPVQAGKYIRWKSAEDSHIRKGIANVSVSALTHITPGMLPALADGSMRYAADGRKTGLLNMLPEDAAYRLGGRGKYRHTIEPFLSFFLTRAVPNALFLRIEQGLNTALDVERRRTR